MRRFISTGLLALAMLTNSVHASDRFERNFELQGVSFRVTSANQGSVNVLKIVPSGKVRQRAVIKREIFGTVSWAEIADLNADGWPEIYVAVTSAGSGSYGTLVAYSVNRGKSITEITLPDLMDDPVASKGYMGHDEFAIVELTLWRRFPVFTAGTANPSGTRQVHYRLQPGEAGWQLKLDRNKTLEF